MRRGSALAYQVAKNTVIRAGAGLFYAPLAFLEQFQGGLQCLDQRLHARREV